MRRSYINLIDVTRPKLIEPVDLTIGIAQTMAFFSAFFAVFMQLDGMNFLEKFVYSLRFFVRGFVGFFLVDLFSEIFNSQNLFSEPPRRSWFSFGSCFRFSVSFNFRHEARVIVLARCVFRSTAGP